jgi:hypothetical protein
MKGIKMTSEEAERNFAEKGIKMIGDFKGTTIPALCKCICGEIYYSRLDSIRRGSNSFCVNCHKKNEYLRKTNPIEKVIEICEKNNYVYVQGYKNTSEKMEVICSCGRTRFVSLDNIKRGRKCGCEPRTKEKHHMWRPDRENLMEERKFKKACYTMVSRCMNRKKNTNHTEELLGYTSKELQEHIKNHSDYKRVIATGLRLSIDHIIPLQAFKDHNMLNDEYVWLINHLDNLKPMANSWNSTKHSSYSEDDFLNYLKKFNVELPD